jgi:hypothetical protein
LCFFEVRVYGSSTPAISPEIGGIGAIYLGGECLLLAKRTFMAQEKADWNLLDLTAVYL